MTSMLNVVVTSQLRFSGIVERMFGVLKIDYGMGQARYLGLARNGIRFGVMCLAYNLRREANIKKSCETSHYSCD
jgi:hypothetical protein